MNRYLENVAVRRVVAMVLLAFAWEVLSRIGVINPFYAPAPSEILRVVSSLFIEGTIYNHLEATFAASLVGLVIGLALGIFLGFAAALVPVLADVLEPIMMLLNAIPRVILAPLFVIWLGIEISSKIALAVVLVAVLIFFAVYNGIKDVNQLFVDRVRTLGGGRLVLLREVYIPSVTAWVLGSLKVEGGFAFLRGSDRATAAALALPGQQGKTRLTSVLSWKFTALVHAIPSKNLPFPSLL